MIAQFEYEYKMQNTQNLDFILFQWNFFQLSNLQFQNNNSIKH